MRVLGIETSCDETGVAIYDSEKGLLTHILHSQVDLHQIYGGVVPELASRDHAKRLLPLVKQALNEANLTIKEIDGVAYTAGPGLMGALLVGACFGRSLGWALGVPTVAIHHLEGHLLAPLLEKNTPEFPFLALLISGAHTMLVYVQEIGQYEILGESVDDAAGEAFDKTAKLLGLGYPGGPELSLLAKQGNPKHFQFPRPMTDRPGLEFSFSGLKTFAANTFKNMNEDLHTRADIARAFQDAVVDTLVIKCRRAMEQTGLQNLLVAGGVSANTALRDKLNAMVKEMGGRTYFPRQEFCTDNGAMIAYAGYLRLSKGKHDDLEINAKARWPIAELS